MDRRQQKKGRRRRRHRAADLAAAAEEGVPSTSSYRPRRRRFRRRRDLETDEQRQLRKSEEQRQQSAAASTSSTAANGDILAQATSLAGIDDDEVLSDTPRDESADNTPPPKKRSRYLQPPIEEFLPDMNSVVAVSPPSSPESPEPIQITKKVITKALIENIGKGMGDSLGNILIELSSHAFKRYIEKGPEYFRTERNGSCVVRLNRWFNELKKSHENLANYLVSSCGIGGAENKSVSELYTNDVKNVIRIVLTKEKLYNESSKRTAVSRGLLKFDTIVDVASDKGIINESRSDTLLASVASEGGEDALNQFDRFKSLLTTVFCPSIIRALTEKNKMSNVNAMSALGQIVKYVETHNTIDGNLPGAEFRALLANINIKILETDLTLDREMVATTSEDKQRNGVNEATKRILIKSLKALSDQKPLSESMNDREDTASDILTVRNSAELASLPLPPIDLLMATNYVNDMLSLEKMAVFTPGTFKSACIMMNQCLANRNRESYTASLPSISSVATKLAKRDIIDTIQNKNDNKGRRRSSSGSGDEESVSSEREMESDSGESEMEREEVEDGGYSPLRSTTPAPVDFYTDNTLILSDIRDLIKKKEYYGIVEYIQKTITASNSSDNTKTYIISALTDLLLSTLEERDALNFKLKRERQLQVGPATKDPDALEEKILEIKQDMASPNSSKEKSMSFMLSDIDRMAVYKHEIVLFNQSLIPSNKVNSSEHVLESFFKTHPLSEDFSEDSIKHPQLDKFLEVITAQASMLVKAFSGVSTIDDKAAGIKALNLKVNQDPSKDIDVGKHMDELSPLKSNPRELFTSRVHAVVVVSPNDPSRLLYPSEEREFGRDVLTRVITWRNLLEKVDNSEEVKQLKTNIAQLSEDSALCTILFSTLKEKHPDRISSVIDGLFYIVAIASRLIVNENNVIAVVDVGLLDRIVDYLYRTFNDSASSVYRGVITNIHSSHAAFPPKATVFARYTARAVSEDFLNKVRKASPDETDKNTNKKTADEGLVNEVSNRTSDVVRSQISNVVSSAVMLHLADELRRADEKRIETFTANNEPIPDELTKYVSYVTDPKIRDTCMGLRKTVIRLSAFLGLSAAIDMLRLSNGLFFSILEKAGVGTSMGSQQQQQQLQQGEGDVKAPSWLRTALKSTLVGKPVSELVATAQEENEKKQKASVVDILNEML